MADLSSLLSRRNLLSGTAGAAALGLLAGCRDSGPSGAELEAAIRRAEAERRPANQRVVEAALLAQPLTVNLGGLVVPTWGYGDAVPGPLLRATAGDLLRVKVANRLPASTSVHFHGVALRNDMDGVPGVTQDPIDPDGTFTYEFTAPDPGTYFYHPHSGVQLDRGLHGVLVVDDPDERGEYDEEWVLVLDDWVDGTGRTPDDILAAFQADTGSPEGDDGAHGMDGMDQDMGDMGDMGSMGGMPGMDAHAMSSPLLGGAGDVEYPHYLVNGRTPDAPRTLSGSPGQRVRIRLVNAGSDTAFRVALGGHRLTVTHSDGFPVEPVETDALLVAMGERYDLTVTLGDGVFPLVAAAEGKNGQGLAVVRTGAGRTPAATVRPAELRGRVLLGVDLVAADEVRLAERSVDRTHMLHLSGSMSPYRWTINGKSHPHAEPLPVEQGERVRLQFMNMSTMFHPMHLHGHTFALVDGGARKDTVIVRPMETVVVDLDADNPGEWMTHCHNIYHAESGMMTTLSYQGL